LPPQPNELPEPRLLATANCRKDVNEIIQSASFDSKSSGEWGNRDRLASMRIEFINEMINLVLQVELVVGP
jgi:hypothetical protein